MGLLQAAHTQLQPSPQDPFVSGVPVADPAAAQERIRAESLSQQNKQKARPQSFISDTVSQRENRAGSFADARPASIIKEPDVSDKN